MPVMTTIAYLPARGVIGIDGPDRVAFLQGLVSNDVTKAEPGRAVWSALLTPQGRYLAEFFILAAGESLLLEAPRASVAELIRRLSRFR
ncbi:MAG: folate-binding protein YgfZ, partial [Acidiphilium sp. 21-68-69]